VKLGGELSFGWRVRAGLTALVIPVLLLFVPLNRLTKWLGRPFGYAKTSPPDRLVADWIDNLLVRLPWPWRHTCLRRCAVLYHLLRRAGRPVDLCIGVKRNDVGELAAHAWLTLDGALHVEGGKEVESEFSLIARFPETATASR
jgi:hypothetical protein